MCLIQKLDNGKMVSIANEQTESCQHPVPYYDIDITSIAHRIKNPLRRTSEHITLHDLKH